MGLGIRIVDVRLGLGSTAGMALYFILRGQVQVHKEWMIRAYVVTFAFVRFRILNDYGPTSHLEPATDRIITLSWVSWTVPLLIAGIILQFRRTRKTA